MIKTLEDWISSLKVTKLLRITLESLIKMFWIFLKRGNLSIKKGQRVKKSTFEEKMDKTMDKLKIMDKSNGQI